MSKLKDLTGQKFGKLTTLYRLHNYHREGAYWLCLCDCGNLKVAFGAKLRNGEIKSCGCLRTKHGKKCTRLYTILRGMKTRCYNKHDTSYKNYGERGVTVCDEWLDNFQVFYDWATNNNYRDGLTIDRIDVDGNYEPSNCRWITIKKQQRNKRNNKKYTINGETHCLSEWCEILNLNYNTVTTRLRHNLSIRQALELEAKNDIYHNDC